MDPIIDAALARSGGWMPFDRFMDIALYTPGLGYYANTLAKFGHMPRSGSDFVTGPELSPLFGQTLAVAVADALDHTATSDVWEFGAGSGALAEQLLGALGDRVSTYTIVDLSGTLRERQQHRLAPWAERVRWVNALPDVIDGVVVGNEVLDAMPVKLLARVGGEWFERGVARAPDGTLAHADQPTDLRPPVDIPGAHDYLTEIHLPAEAFVATLAEHLGNGAAFFLDYGFPESEYYHPQRHMGTVMCHRGHQADGNALVDVGLKDITAHVNFTGVALAGQDAGMSVLGYCSQARFLINCGLVQRLEGADVQQRAMAARLVHEHEMGELFKVIGFCNGEPWDAVGFSEGDRSHTL
ncbi:SAM-dependent methyltransferase [Variovorax dokdonensis]|uniref:SAM-dependent methyltransferase n=1 Tax=Variovorax dokdonensis TaxID=344883 RepID=A0ABT7N5L2_9BURK|nr:SAM-dependent methyltransferase [Variovorax dokdonensis]MDM0043208.1 SAM-dependent methyltransferase [Variovorax dokdonensis]